MKILFMGINFHGEGSIHGANTVNGYIEHAENIVEVLSEIADVIVATDQPERYNKRNFQAINLYHSIVPNLANINQFWRKAFPVVTGNEDEFSRDTLYKLIHLANSLDLEKLTELQVNNHFDYVMLNRHECFFMQELAIFKETKLIYVAHDSQYLRRLNYQDFYGIDQSLVCIEQVVEKSLLQKSERVLAICSKEAEYFKGVAGDNVKVFVFRPKVTKPLGLVTLQISGRVKIYFLGVNNFVNRQTLLAALEMLELITDKESFEFHVIGSVCSILDGVERSFKVIAHGQVESLEGVMAGCDVLLAPVLLGSGAPIKIADALSYGHYVITTESVASVYLEFIGERIFIGSNIEKILNIIKKSEQGITSIPVYENYSNQNKMELKRLLKS